MSIMWGSNEGLVIAVLLLFCTAVSMQVAPGDEHQECIDRNQFLPRDPTEIVLMDSRNYEVLLGDGGVWDQIDFDNNNPSAGSFLNPTYFQQNVGGICRWTVKSCGYRSGSQDNWLFTQYIDKTTPPNTDYDVTLYIHILYTLSNCRRRLGCTPIIGVHIFNTTGPQPRHVYTNTNNYHQLIARDRASTLTQRLTITTDVSPDIEGSYIAIHDNTSCIQISQLRVYRYQCARKQEGLVIFPETAAPVENPQSVITQCMPNSHNVTDLLVECENNGIWSGSAECVCDAGYERRTNSDEEFFCKPCRAGYYRSDNDPQTSCKRCPSNTAVDVVAAPICQCLTGYFRNTEGLDDECPAGQTLEDAGDPCTKPPSTPLNLNATHITDTTISIEWSQPTFLGERNDLYYIVQYTDPNPDNVGGMFVAQCIEGCLNNTQCTLTGLKPATTYVVYVLSHNGVSDQDKGGGLARQTKKTFTTDIAPPSRPTNILPFCEVIVWSAPIQTNGDITGYDIMFMFNNGSTTVIELLGDKTVYVRNFTLPSKSIEFKVRAVNDAGPGPYSELYQLVCGNVAVGEPLADCPVCPSPSTPPDASSICPSIPVSATTVSVTDTTTETVTTTATINATVTDTVPQPTTVSVTVPTILAITVPTTITSTTTIRATVTETVPVPTTVAVTVPTTVAATITKTAIINATVTEIVPVPTTVVEAVPTTIAVTVPKTVTATETVNVTVTEVVPVPTTVAATIPTTVVVNVPTTIATTETISVTVTENVPAPTTVVSTIPTTVVVPTTVTATKTVNTTVTETVPLPTTVVVTVPTTVAATVPTTVAVPTTVTTTATINATVTETIPVATTVAVTTTATINATIVVPTTVTTTSTTSTVVTSTELCATPSTTPMITPTTTSLEGSPASDGVSPLPCPTDAPASVQAAETVENVKLLSCGILVWDRPTSRDCHNERLSYKVRIYNGTTYSDTDPAHRLVLWVDTTWVKLTDSCMPCVKPLHIVIKARKEDGVHADEWSEPLTMTESYVMDCPW